MTVPHPNSIAHDMIAHLRARSCEHLSGDVPPTLARFLSIEAMNRGCTPWEVLIYGAFEWYTPDLEEQSKRDEGVA